MRSALRRPQNRQGLGTVNDDRNLAPFPVIRFQYLSQHSVIKGCGCGTTWPEEAARGGGCVPAIDHVWGSARSRACRGIGIPRRTGCRWRAERCGPALLRLAEDGYGESYLSLLERQRRTAAEPSPAPYRGRSRDRHAPPTRVACSARGLVVPHESPVHDAGPVYCGRRANDHVVNDDHPLGSCLDCGDPAGDAG